MIRPSLPVLVIGALCLAFAGVASASEVPAPKREGIEWVDIWVVQGNSPELTPRTLLIGDSITRAYYGDVCKHLEGGGACDRLATSAALCDPALAATVALVLNQRHYDVIHINNGMHGWDYSEQEYGDAILPMVKLLRTLAPHARLIWATTTPTSGGMADKNGRIDERNRLVRSALAHTDIVLDDLHAVVAADPTLISGDGVHMTPAGCEALGTAVAAAITATHGTSGSPGH